MIKAELCRKNNVATIQAEGEIPEILGDLAILIGGIYRQLQGANNLPAMLFRHGLTGMINDANSPIWQGDIGDYTGYTIKKN